MALPVVKINNSTGSNTQASGAGPGDGTTGGSAIVGTNGSFVGSVVTLPNADLSNVLTDGSHCLYLVTTTGRRLFGITAKANSGTASANVTVANAPTGTSTARTYAIGGKRLDFETTNTDTKRIFSEGAAGWRAELEYTGTDYTLTSTVTWSISGSLTAGTFELVGTGGTPTITSSTASLAMFTVSGTDYLRFENIKFQNTNASLSSRGIAIKNTGSVSTDLFFVNCTFDGVGRALSAESSAQRVFFDNCWFKNLAEYIVAGAISGDMIGCYAEGCNQTLGSNPLIALTDGVTNTWTVRDSIFDSNSAKILQTGTSASLNRIIFSENACYNGSDTVVDIRHTAVSAGWQMSFLNNILYGNTGYGVSMSGIANSNLLDIMLPLNQSNAFGNNGSGDRNGMPTGDDVSLTASPWIDAANDDFTPNRSSGGGLELQGGGFPNSYPSDSIVSNRQIGPIKPASRNVHQSAMSGGFR